MSEQPRTASVTCICGRKFHIPRGFALRIEQMGTPLRCVAHYSVTVEESRADEWDGEPPTCPLCHAAHATLACPRDIAAAKEPTR